MRLRSHRAAGFTLIELAIVVGIAGLLFSGLWRLMSSGNSQLREQGAADQLNQIASATRSFLASPEGQALLRAPDASAGAVAIPLFLPPQANPAGTGVGCVNAVNALLPNSGTYCNFLPAGFSDGTTNSYNQSYVVVVRKLDGGANATPQNYDFMISTQAGDVISDNSGGRISANIGASGGFIYGAATCPALAPVVTNACGAFGGFTFNPAAAAVGGGFGIANPGAGHIVTLNSKGGEVGASSQWLARLQIDPLFTFNTMREDLTMGPNLRVPARITNIEMAPPGGGAAGRINMRTGIINLNDGTNNQLALTNRAINLENGTIQGPGSITINNTDGATIPVTADTLTGTPALTQPAIAIQATGQIGCDITLGGPGCNQALQVTGNANISESMSVGNNGSYGGQLSAGAFLYSSDMRLKKQIVPLTGALDKIMQLHGYKFRWRNDDREDVGLVAQDVQKIYPELVRTIGSDGKLGVEYGNLIAPMIEAIKELKTQNDQLRTRIEAQQRTLDALQKD